VTIRLPSDPDLRTTLGAFQAVQNAITKDAFNHGKPISAVELQRRVYIRVKGTLSSQMTITALRLVVGAYASALRNRKRRLRLEAKRRKRYESKRWTYNPRSIKPLSVCHFERPAAMFLIGVRGRDADFRADGTLSIWTVGGRKRLGYRLSHAHRPLFDAAKEIDSITVIERKGKLYGRVALTLEASEPEGIVPVGIDLNETNALVAVDADDRDLFISGLSTKVKNKRTAHTVSRLQKKLAARKAAGKDTRSVRRACKRLSRRRSLRTRDFARCTAKRLMQWAPADAVLVFEDLQMQQPEKGLARGTALRRRLAHWSYGAIHRAVANKAELAGIAVVTVDPAYTSKICSRCGLLGVRKRHRFTCRACGFYAHADWNAARNIRNRFVQSRLHGLSSASPEACSPETGKLMPSGMRS
jgi:IS605 OrfB family transposase